eukprot:NODE_5947_length_664_cov_34.165854_g5034_i0.p4 GENE.NODE_5947_length_664_cov_34.165854_g5034_i0~~NODE_5947_length_664_cov_34.165854_g5034_i0.p4  ORF type:complete len:72 (-),score=18.70 NODE_5947_length_664_cov_34.165854_g5034_i0:357-572(-)
MSQKATKIIAAKDGEERTYTVNKDGQINAHAGAFLANHGGHVSKDQDVATPVSCRVDPNKKGGFGCRLGGK